MRGPPPVDGRLRNVRVIKGVVESVDKLRHTYDVHDEMGGVHNGIKYVPAYVEADGAGSFVVPRVQTVVWLMFPSTARTPFIFACETPPRQLDEGDDLEDPNDFRQNRPVINEGDHVLASSSPGGFAILRASGVLEFGASQFAKRLYIPVRNTIRDYFENWFVNSAAGTMSWTSRREDDRHGPDRTPVEFKLDIKDFSEDDPIIKVRLGRVQEEDEKQIPFGGKDSILAVLNINERAKVWVDKKGNVASVTYGGVTHAFEGPVVMSYASQLSRTVRGKLIEKLGDVQQQVVRTRKVSVGQLDEIEAGSIVRSARSNYVRKTGQTDFVEIGGQAVRQVAADEHHSVGSKLKLTVGGNLGESVGGDRLGTVSGVHSVIVANLNGDDFGSVHKVARGKLLVQTVLDDIVFGVGPTPDALISKVTMKLDGTIKLEGSAGTTVVELNSTGASITTPGGTLSVDNAGTVVQGPAGPAGAVVTTLSHPVDFMTGIPIKGTGSVGAGGAPNVIALPSSFVSTG